MLSGIVMLFLSGDIDLLDVLRILCEILGPILGYYVNF